MLVAIVSCLLGLAAAGHHGHKNLDAAVCDLNYGEWETTKTCVSPEMQLEDLPESCRNIIPKPNGLNDKFYKFLQSKYVDHFYGYMDECKARGMKGMCGGCNFKIKCRMLKDAPNKIETCALKQMVYIFDDECQNNEPCELSMKDGKCDAPKSFNGWHSRSDIQAMLRKGADLADIDKVEKLAEMMNGMGVDPEELSPPEWMGILPQIEMGPNESLIKPQMNCMPNKDRSGCLCCCGWRVPDPETNTCIDMEEDLKAFVKMYGPDTTNMLLGESTVLLCCNEHNQPNCSLASDDIHLIA